MMLEENSFGALLTYLRKRSKLVLARQGIGWTQAAVAEALEVSERTYKSWERGERVPDQHYLKKIAALFRLRTEDEDRLYREASQAPPKVHNLPFPRNPLFTGREAQLEQIKQSLQDNGSVALTQPVSISGLGGIGKTQLALEYAYRCYPNVYRAVLWVNAADEASLKLSYGDLAQLLDLPERDERELDIPVKQWLERHTNWLLIMDNADDLLLTRSFFPKAHQGHILLTTRSQIIGNIAVKIDVDRMEPEEGLRFLLRRSGMLEADAPLDTIAADIRQVALEVVELLGGHPLALDQAGAYVEDTGVSFSDYIRLYYEERSHLLSERGSLDEEHPELSEHPESIVVTFSLCVEQADEKHPLAIYILCFCAFLQPDDIPMELFQHDKSFVRDKTALGKGITVLQRYSLIKRNVEEQTFSMHRLVQTVLIDAMPPDHQKRWKSHIVRTLLAAFPPLRSIQKFEEITGMELYDTTEYIRNERNERLLPHILDCATWEDDEATLSVEYGTLLGNAGSYLHELGQYSESVPLLTRSNLLLWSLLEGKTPELAYTVASGLDELATLSEYNRSDKKHTEFIYQQALAISGEFLGAEHKLTLHIKSNYDFFHRSNKKRPSTCTK